MKISRGVLFWVFAVEMVFVFLLVLHLVIGPTDSTDQEMGPPATVQKKEARKGKLKEKLSSPQQYSDHLARLKESYQQQSRGPPGGQDKPIQQATGLEGNVLSSLVLAHTMERSAVAKGRRQGDGEADGDVFFSVKTGANNLNTKLPLLLLTWMKMLAPGQV